jgi:lipoate-protein ligase B
MEYGQTLRLQRELIAKRTADEIPNTLLLLEHPATFTLGVDAHREHLLVSEQELIRLNIAYHTVDRSGSVVYHCPGQLVVYPILKLGKNHYNYHQYINMLESVIIYALASFKVRAFRQQGQRGIWVFTGKLSAQDDQPHHPDTVAKIGAVDVKVNRDSVTSHGFWINVNPSLQYFDLVVPTGVKDRYVTSLQHVLNESIEINTVVKSVIQSFCQVFETEPLALDAAITTGHNYTWDPPHKYDKLNRPK